MPATLGDLQIERKPRLASPARPPDSAAMVSLPRAAFALLLALAGGGGALGEAASDEAGCRRLVFEEAPYVVCEAPADADLRLFLTDPAGAPFAHFFRVDQALAPGEEQLVFAMNAGMYHEDRSPVGLYVEKGEEAVPLNTAPGPGNFHLLPNGVFFIAGGRAQVLDAHAYEMAAPEARFATQSGPMLVMDGELHPRFRRASESLKRRNGVGVSADGETVYFVMSDALVNFHTFARLFRDGLGCDNALFLDGTISRLHAPALGRSEFGLAMGPIVGLVGPKPEAAPDG